MTIVKYSFFAKMYTEEYEWNVKDLVSASINESMSSSREKIGWQLFFLFQDELLQGSLHLKMAEKFSLCSLSEAQLNIIEQVSELFRKVVGPLLKCYRIFDHFNQADHLIGPICPHIRSYEKILDMYGTQLYEFYDLLKKLKGIYDHIPL